MVPPVQRCSVSSTSFESDFSSVKIRKSKSGKHFPDCQQSGMSRNAARERYRVKSLRNAFQNLQQCLPSVPPNTKLSKLDVLILATTYISHLSKILSEDDAFQENNYNLNEFELMENSIYAATEVEFRSTNWEKSYLHPVKKWPMRSRLYAGVEDKNTSESSSVSNLQQISWN
ncbi:transcription factor 24-like isoform X2 [Uloborus diversus]|nr:transcription factor 24-like isoform X2 [Uloborus diversus]